MTVMPTVAESCKQCKDTFLACAGCGERTCSKHYHPLWLVPMQGAAEGYGYTVTVALRMCSKCQEKKWNLTLVADAPVREAQP